MQWVRAGCLGIISLSNLDQHQITLTCFKPGLDVTVQAQPVQQVVWITPQSLCLVTPNPYFVSHPFLKVSCSRQKNGKICINFLAKASMEIWWTLNSFNGKNTGNHLQKNWGSFIHFIPYPRVAMLQGTSSSSSSGFKTCLLECTCRRHLIKQR